MGQPRRCRAVREPPAGGVGAVLPHLARLAAWISGSLVVVVSVVVARALAVVHVVVAVARPPRPHAPGEIGGGGLVGVQHAREQREPGRHGPDRLAVQPGRLVDVAPQAVAVEVRVVTNDGCAHAPLTDAPVPQRRPPP